jgi:purine-nucleoside phosphorylase
MIKMATPHLEFNIEDVSNIVLMPGDPLRAKFIADTYLNDVKLINKVRNMLGYTGYYKGKKVSIISSGMGIPSIGIYSYELYKFYNVEKIIRIGTCGEYSKKLNLYDVILIDNSYSDSSYGYVQNGSKENLIPSSKNLTDKIEDTALKTGINIIRSNVYTTEVFTPYADKKPNLEELEMKYNCICTEMEAFALFHNAKVLNKEAACILTATDSIDENKSISSEEREKALDKMIILALESTLNL